MAMLSDAVSRDLSEYLVLTDDVKASPEEVSLETRIGESIVLQYPYMTARVQSVVGPEMAVAAGREGILTLIPRSLPDWDKQAIIDANNRSRLKKGDIEFVAEPSFAFPTHTLKQVIHQVNKTGHS